jgi:hypothetical protein
MLKSRHNTLIGRKGGEVSSDQKPLAARQNVRLRWHGKTADGSKRRYNTLNGEESAYAATAIWFTADGRTVANSGDRS